MIKWLNRRGIVLVYERENASNLEADKILLRVYLDCVGSGNTIFLYMLAEIHQWAYVLGSVKKNS